MHQRRTVTSIVTGKPVEIGGSRGRVEATGRGVMIAAREAGRVHGIRSTAPAPSSIRRRRLRLGEDAAQGAKVVGVSDVYGALANPDGLDVPRSSTTSRRRRA